MMKRIVLFFLNPFLGKKAFQHFFQKLHYIALYGQNYGRSGEYEESGEKVTIDLILQKTENQTRSVIFDVGANIGKYSTYVLERCKSNCLVYSFEPSPTTFLRLKKSLEPFKNAFPVNIGFGRSDEKTILYNNEINTTHASLFSRDMSHWGTQFALDKAETVEIQTIDEFCMNNKIEWIDFLKIDVEGFEFNLLQGAEKMLESRSIRFIQFEVGVCAVDAKYFFKDIYQLLAKDYNLFRILKDGLYPIQKYNELLEVFLTTNYLAVLKNKF